MLQNEADAYRKIRLRAEDVQGRNVLTNFWVRMSCHIVHAVLSRPVSGSTSGGGGSSSGAGSTFSLVAPSVRSTACAASGGGEQGDSGAALPSRHFARSSSGHSVKADLAAGSKVDSATEHTAVQHSLLRTHCCGKRAAALPLTRDCCHVLQGMDFTTDKLRSLVRKWQTLIEAHVDVKTTDGYLLRLFCISFTMKRPGQIKKTCYAQTSQVPIFACTWVLLTRSCLACFGMRMVNRTSLHAFSTPQIRAIRKKMVEIMQREASSCDLKELVGKFIPESIGQPSCITAGQHNMVATLSCTIGKPSYSPSGLMCCFLACRQGHREGVPGHLPAAEHLCAQGEGAALPQVRRHQADGGARRLHRGGGCRQQCVRLDMRCVPCLLHLPTLVCMHCTGKCLGVRQAALLGRLTAGY